MKTLENLYSGERWDDFDFEAIDKIYDSIEKIWKYNGYITVAFSALLIVLFLMWILPKREEDKYDIRVDDPEYDYDLEEYSTEEEAAAIAPTANNAPEVPRRPGTPPSLSEFLKNRNQ